MDIRRFLLAAILFSATLFAAPQPKPPVSGAWHTYTLDWRPDSMTMLLDGKAVYRYTGEDIPSTSMYIVLSNGVMKGGKAGAGLHAG